MQSIYLEMKDKKKQEPSFKNPSKFLKNENVSSSFVCLSLFVFCLFFLFCFVSD